jgi:hypothetical protein
MTDANSSGLQRAADRLLLAISAAESDTSTAVAVAWVDDDMLQRLGQEGGDAFNALAQPAKRTEVADLVRDSGRRMAEAFGEQIASATALQAALILRLAAITGRSPADLIAEILSEGG